MIIKYRIPPIANHDVELELIDVMTVLQVLFQKDEERIVYTCPDDDYSGQLVTLNQFRNVVSAGP